MTSKKPLKILFLEDEINDIQLEVRALEKAGLIIEKTIATTLDEFKLALANASYDIVISDYNIPPYTGIDAFKALNELKKEIPFILVSGAIGEDKAVEALKEGIKDYILKANLARLPQAIENAIRMSKLKTDQQNAFVSLKNSEEKFRTLASVIPDIIFELNEEAQIIWSNESGINFFGQNIVGTYFNKIYENENNIESEMISPLFKQLKTQINFQTMINSIDQSHRLIDWKCSFFSTNLGKSVIAIGRDSTDVEFTKKELSKVIVELQKTNSELDRFSGFVANHLQEPLRSISSFLTLLEEKYKGKIDPDADVFIKYAVTASQRVSMLIGDLLEYYRYANQKFEQTKVSTKDIIQKAQKNLEHIISTSSAQIEITGELPEIVGNEEQLIKLFENLITNAIKFKSETAPLIRIQTKIDKNLLEFVIDDNGIGIESEYHKKIFDMFQTIHTFHQYPGTGIGLSICKKIVENHKGSIWVESAPRKGATFHFTLTM